MRQIDGDALRDKLQSLAYDDWNQGVNTSWANAYNECADIVDDMPAIEPQRMRGKWNVYYHGEENGKSIFSYSCNQCGYSAPYNLIGGVCEQKKWNFCPNCGADMRGTEE